MGYLAKYCSDLPHFCCNGVYNWYVDDLYINDTNQISGWWDMREWWWKIGFTPWAIRHVRRNWQFSISGVAKKTPLGTKFRNCQRGRTYSIHISKVPVFRASVDPLWKIIYGLMYIRYLYILPMVLPIYVCRIYTASGTAKGSGQPCMY
jgi:hypothetical protein